ncbi:hypothetical protein B0T16DRAFT_459159 [Cercophora newfieldiana]|uniref:arginine--tRNA ligase n=1 Tax=Cercophora newfieldiana TaxID=92897 RepID=A0AA40CN03_9PEZI|nr:hypothetical protein B0T16DRAFT_459159 [Cercophora newfieldiana]
MATRTLDGLTALLQGLDLDEIPTFPSADPLRQPVDIFHAYLAVALQALVGCDAQQAYDSITPANTVGNGDLDIVLPKLKLPGDPNLQDLAADITRNFPAHPLFVVPWKDKAHVRFCLQPKALPRILLPYILDRGPSYGILQDPDSPDPPSDQKTVLVEFSSPNLGQDFRTDHLRSTILGAFVSNTYEAMGWHVIRTNYLGDWGNHIGLLSLGWDRHGGSDEIFSKPPGEAFRAIHDIYSKMHDEMEPKIAAKRKKAKEKQEGASPVEEEEEEAIFAERAAAFKRLEEGDAKEVELWEKIRKISVEYYEGTYKKMGVVFDDYSGESLVCRDGKGVQGVEEKLKELGISEQDEHGLWVVNFANHGNVKLGTGTLRGKDGITGYLLRDIASVLHRHEKYGFDKLIFVVGEQNQHFQQVALVIKLMGLPEIEAKLQHLTFAKNPSVPIWGESGLLGDILERCEQYAQLAAADSGAFPPRLQVNEKLNTLGINTLAIQELNTRKGNKGISTSFDGEALMLTEGETGLGLQLGYARLCTAIDDIGSSSGSSSSSSSSSEIDFSSLWEGSWIEVLRLLARFPAVTNAAHKSLEPGPLLTYMFSVLDELGYCLDDVEEEDEAGGQESDGSKFAARSLLFRSTKQVLENGMRLLNVTPVS